ncbi:MAG: 4'-phosphopantetheinyl transferase superfamily protein [Streptosporangiaceae bacterium]
MSDYEFGCVIRWANLDEDAPADLGLLDAVERARRERYLREGDRDRFAMGVQLTKLELAARTGLDPQEISLDRTCPGCGATHGRPVHPAAHISVSHSEAMVGVAVAEVPVGLDVERGGRDISEVARHLLSPGDPPGELVVAWTRKEALLKATGDGLKVPMVDLTLADGPPRLVSWKGRDDLPGRFRLYDLEPGPGYAGALALLSSG